MFQSTKSLFINPQYTTNNIDSQNAGWYQITPNASDLALRVNYSNIELVGEIRLNTTELPYVFQGNNGSGWVDFNSTKGDMGLPGKDFTNAVNFNNLGSNTDIKIQVELGSIFATTYVSIEEDLSNVNIRSLEGSEYIVNSNLTIDSMILTQNSNTIAINPQPIPYVWDFTNGNNTKNYLKNSSLDAIFYSWGETSKWVVAPLSTVKKGQAVRLTNTANNVCIIPITYTTTLGQNSFTTPYNMLGIALQDANGGQSCLVCTKGITTVLCSNQVDSSSNFLYTVNLSTPGLYGIVGRDGGIFCNTQSTPTVDYIIAGYFLESGNNIVINNQYALFYVNPQVHIG